MKRIVFIIIATVLLSACAKKRTCTCLVSTTYSNGSATTSENITRTYEKVSKRYAKNDCSDKTERSSSFTSTYSNCKISD